VFGPHYRPEIDGLRGVAVMAVVLFHAGLGCPGGFVGVDVFFVISGYLITSILLREMDRDKFSFRNFWERRLRRIFPAMAVCMLVTLGFGGFWLLPSDASDAGQSALSQLALVSNFYFWRTTNYFGGDIFEKPLLHTWSLSVEEQFYLLFPVFLWILWRFSRPEGARRWRIGMSAILLLVSLGLSVWAVEHQPYAGFYLLPTRAWELLCGSLLAALPSVRNPRQWVSEILAFLGLGAILVAVLLYSERTPFPGVASLLPCLGTMLILWSNCGQAANSEERKLTLVGKALALWPMRSIGLISYSLYLWHWPVIVYAKYWQLESPTIVERWGFVVLAFAFAYASWKFVETPVRTRQCWSSSRSLWVNSLLMGAVLLILSVALYQEWLVSEQRYASVASIRQVADENGAFFKESLKKWSDQTQLESIEADQLNLLGSTSDKGHLDFVLLGDSHAYQLVLLADRLAKKAGISGAIISHVATPPLVNWQHSIRDGVQDHEPYIEAQIAYVKRNRVKHVILHAFWANYQGVNHEFRDSLLAAIQAFEEAGARVHVLMGVPDYPAGLVRMVNREHFFGGLWKVPETIVSPSQHQKRNAQMYELQAIVPGVSFIDATGRLLAPDGKSYLLAVAGNLLYFDGNHLNQRGVELAWKDLLHSLFHEVVKTSGSSVDGPSAGPANLNSVN
jgi:peptidoglycan/LPS O-acetylase OafA/YrhL